MYWWCAVTLCPSASIRRNPPPPLATHTPLTPATPPPLSTALATPPAKTAPRCKRSKAGALVKVTSWCPLHVLRTRLDTVVGTDLVPGALELGAASTGTACALGDLAARVAATCACDDWDSDSDGEMKVRTDKFHGHRVHLSHARTHDTHSLSRCVSIQSSSRRSPHIRWMLLSSPRGLGAGRMRVGRRTG